MYNIQPKTKIIGKIHKFVPTCHSTNDLALEIIQNTENFHGTVILSAFQTAGRGQKGNTWESEAGKNLIFSVALDTSFLAVSDQFYISMAMSLAVFDTLQQLNIPNCSIKWPNDVFVGNTKVGGMLIENKSRGQYLRGSVVGIGLNVFQETFESERASSLFLSGLDPEITLNTIVETLCLHIETYFNYLEQGRFEELHLSYLKIIYKLGKEQLFEVSNQPFMAVIVGVDTDGRLIVRKEKDTLKFEIKQIKYLF